MEALAQLARSGRRFFRRSDTGDPDTDYSGGRRYPGCASSRRRRHDFQWSRDLSRRAGGRYGIAALCGTGIWWPVRRKRCRILRFPVRDVSWRCRWLFSPKIGVRRRSVLVRPGWCRRLWRVLGSTVFERRFRTGRILGRRWRRWRLRLRLFALVRKRRRRSSRNYVHLLVAPVRKFQVPGGNGFRQIHCCPKILLGRTRKIPPVRPTPPRRLR